MGSRCRYRGPEIPRDFVVRRLSSRNNWSFIARARMAQPLLPPPPSLSPARLPDGSVIDPGPVPELRDLGLSPNAPAETHPAGEAVARHTLCSFLDERCAPVTAWDGCSAASSPAKRFSLGAFEERLHWRSHFIQKLEDQRSFEHHSYIAAFDGLRLAPGTDQRAADRYQAWANGATGYPMVDGINFRMRAMLVSFASYDLWLDWRATATSGPIVHRLRIYDPGKQGLDHDPNGDLVRRWVPELADVDGPAVHQRWLLAGTFWGVPPMYPSAARRKPR